MNKAWIKFHNDTGSQANILTQSDYESLKPKPGLSSTQLKLRAYNGERIQVVGVCKVQVK